MPDCAGSATASCCTESKALLDAQSIKERVQGASLWLLLVQSLVYAKHCFAASLDMASAVQLVAFLFALEVAKAWASQVSLPA